jgi:FkbH-like protein
MKNFQNEGGMISEEQIKKAAAEEQSIKCVVWDLDNTIWDGVLLEDKTVILKERIPDIIKELDKRGILQSISSKNEFNIAKGKLEEFDLWDYFLYPQINWGTKSSSIQKIAKLLNISLGTFAFIDDQPFERDEVEHVNPDVMCIDALKINDLLNIKRMTPKFITEESSIRRKLYQSDIQRKIAEEEFEGANENFLASLNLKFEIKKADESDLQRVEELTLRTHQLNTTGYTYSYDELDQLRTSNDHLLLVSKLTDKYGPYGTIGLVLIEKNQDYWMIKLLLMSCRVMSRGVGTIMMSYIMTLAKDMGVKIRAEFLPNNVNRMMFVTYKFGGFQEIDKKDDLIILEHDLIEIQSYPPYVQLILPNLSEEKCTA